MTKMYCINYEPKDKTRFCDKKKKEKPGFEVMTFLPRPFHVRSGIHIPQPPLPFHEPLRTFFNEAKVCRVNLFRRLAVGIFMHLFLTRLLRGSGTEANDLSTRLHNEFANPACQSLTRPLIHDQHRDFCRPLRGREDAL